MKASSRRKSSTGDASQPSLFGDLSIEAYVDHTSAVDPPPSTSSDFSLCAMLDNILTVQAAYGQVLLDVLNEVTSLRADLANARGSTSQASPSNEL